MFLGGGGSSGDHGSGTGSGMYWRGMAYRGIGLSARGYSRRDGDGGRGKEIRRRGPSQLDIDTFDLARGRTLRSDLKFCHGRAGGERSRRGDQGVGDEEFGNLGDSFLISLFYSLTRPNVSQRCLPSATKSRSKTRSSRRRRPPRPPRARPLPLSRSNPKSTPPVSSVSTLDSPSRASPSSTR